MMQALIFALIAYVGWATADIAGAIYSRRIGGYRTTFWSYLFRSVIFLFYIPFTISDWKHLRFANLSLTVLLSAIFIIGVCLFLEAFRSANASLVGTISAAFVVPTIILSVIFLHETLTMPQVIAICVIFVGLIFTSLDFDSFRGKKFVLDKGILLAFVVMILWGIYFSFIKIPVKELGWFIPSYIAYLVFPLVLVIMRFKKLPIALPIKNHGGLIAFAGFTILGTVGNLAYNLGIEKGYVSTVIPIAGSYPTLFVVLTFLVFKDKLKKSQVLGICISLAGIVAMSFLSK